MMNWRERFSNIKSSDVPLPGSVQTVFSVQEEEGTGVDFSTFWVGIINIMTVNTSKMAIGIKNILVIRCMVMVFG